MNDSGNYKTEGILPIARQWANAAESVIESMVSARPSVVVQPTRCALADSFSWWRQSFSISPDGGLWIGAPESSWDDLGRYILATLGVDAPEPDDIHATCRDLVAQVGSSFAQELSQTLPKEITCGDVATAQLKSDDGAAFTFTIDAGLINVAGRLSFDTELLEKLVGPPVSPSTSPDLPGAVATISLPARVVLGHARMPLKDLWKLNVGSFIKLDRSADDPADVLIREQLIARGQVVSVNGNYGIRILVVGSREDGGTLP